MLSSICKQSRESMQSQRSKGKQESYGGKALSLDWKSEEVTDDESGDWWVDRTDAGSATQRIGRVRIGDISE